MDCDTLFIQDPRFRDPLGLVLEKVQKFDKYSGLAAVSPSMVVACLSSGWSAFFNRKDMDRLDFVLERKAHLLGCVPPMSLRLAEHALMQEVSPADFSRIAAYCGSGLVAHIDGLPFRQVFGAAAPPAPRGPTRAAAAGPTLSDLAATPCLSGSLAGLRLVCVSSVGTRESGTEASGQIDLGPLSSLTSLSRLFLGGKPDTWTGVDSLAKLAPSLVSLELALDSGLAPPVIAAVQALTRVSSLSVHSLAAGIELPAQLASLMEPLRGLRRLRLQQITGNLQPLLYTLSLVPGAPLESLELVMCHGPVNSVSSSSSRGLDNIGLLANLKRLVYDGSSATDAEVQHFSSLARLTELSLPFSSVTDAGLHHLSSLVNLRLLNLRCPHDSFTGEGLSALRRLSRLRSLWLQGSPRLESKAIRHIAQNFAASLRDLQMDDCLCLDYDCFKHIAKLTALTNLDLSRVPTPDGPAWQQLSTLRRLRRLELTPYNRVRGASGRMKVGEALPSAPRLKLAWDKVEILAW